MLNNGCVRFLLTALKNHVSYSPNGSGLFTAILGSLPLLVATMAGYPSPSKPA